MIPKLVYILLILVFSLNLGDCVTTYIGLTTGIAEEGNPSVVSLFEKMGIIPAMLSKMALVSFFCLLLMVGSLRHWHDKKAWKRKIFRRTSWITLIPVAVFYFIIVSSNIFVLTN